MGIPAVFTVVRSLVIVYVVLGNIVYFRHVLPALGESPSWGSAQFKQFDRYVALLSPRRDRPWFFLFLKHIRAVTGILLALMVLVGVLAWLEAM